MAENNEKNTAKKDGLKKLLTSRKARHGSVAVIITAIAVAVVILINVITGLLVDRFPDMKADFTANKAFELSDDTVEYMSRLKKDVKLYIIGDEKDFLNSSTYFVQADNLLEKMESKSGRRFTYEYIDTTENPNFVKKYPNLNWTTNEIVAVIECGSQYKGLKIDDCFTYDEEYYNYYGMYKWTGTTIEQAVVKGALYVTSENRVVVDVLTGEGESGYEGVTDLLSDNAYEVNEVSLLTGKLSENADFVLVYAPQSDIGDKAYETLKAWLENSGKYGKTLIYVPADPRIGKVEAPNLDALLNEYGMELYDGVVYETSSNYKLDYSAGFDYSFIVEPSEDYTKDLKNSNLPIAAMYAQGINIKDANTAHALLSASEESGVLPGDADESFDFQKSIQNEAIAVAAEGQKAGTDAYSRVVVFGSSTMLGKSALSYPSFNNDAYFMNVINTIADKDDDTVVIQSKTLSSTTLGAPSESTSNTILIVFVVIIPAAILIAGIVLWVRRRNQ